MSRGDSILQTASIARWMSVGMTTNDQNIFKSRAQPTELYAGISRRDAVMLWEETLPVRTAGGLQSRLPSRASVAGEDP